MAFARVISGGQTGVDRAALDAASSVGVPIGGWCPRGRLAEDGPIPELYPLVETVSPRYVERTRLNVAHSDGTLILNRGPLRGGTRLTCMYAGRLGRALLVLDLDGLYTLHAAQLWLVSKRIRVLNVAGPRESNRPGIYRDARKLLTQLFSAAVTPQHQSPTPTPRRRA